MPKKRHGKPGLLFSATKIEIEQVKPSHKKLCHACDELPIDYRLKVDKGVARSKRQYVFCEGCGDKFLADLRREVSRARKHLIDGRTPVRLLDDERRSPAV